MDDPRAATVASSDPRVAARLDSGASGVSLAPEIHRSACRRLAWASLSYSIGYAAAFGYYWIRAVVHDVPGPDLFSTVVSGLAISFGLLVYHRTRCCYRALEHSCRPGTSRPFVDYSNLASIFQVVAALGIISGYGWGWEHDLQASLTATGAALGIPSADIQSQLVDKLVSGGARFFQFSGVTWVGAWVVFFPLLVPSEPRRSAWASFSAATTVPFVLVGSILINGIPETVRPWVFEYLSNFIVPTYICAGLSVVGSRVVYKLTHELSVARRMGSYQLVERLGSGGMGEVWRARHQMLARPGAIKIIHPEALGGGNDVSAAIARRRFEQEAQATASLKSPHTIDLYDFGVTDGGDFFYVMELLDGLDLRTLVEKHGPVPVARASCLIRQACHSLMEAHARGLIHRDIKPANIFICRHGLEYDFVKVLDFGLVKRTSDAESNTAQLTGAGMAPGTPTFMPPEMARDGRALDARTDLYALGCVAYWLVTGQLVFEGDSPMAVIIRHVQDPPPPPSTRTELPIPPEFDRIILECLEKDPERRPQTAEKLSRRLEECEKRLGGWTQVQAEQWWSLHVPSVNSDVQPVPLTVSTRAVEGCE